MTEEKKKLTQTEYRAMWAIIGATNTLAFDLDKIQKRLKSMPGAWRDARCALKMLQKTMSAVLSTIPAEGKLSLIQQMKYTVTRTVTETPGLNTGIDKSVLYMDENAYIRLCSRAMADNCFYCMKSGKEFKRCKLFKDMQDTIHFAIPEGYKGECPFCGCLEYPVTEAENGI